MSPNRKWSNDILFFFITFQDEAWTFGWHIYRWEYSDLDTHGHLQRCHTLPFLFLQITIMSIFCSTSVNFRYQKWRSPTLISIAIPALFTRKNYNMRISTFFPFSLSASQSNWYFTQNKQNIRQYIEHIYRRSNIKTAGRIIWAFEFFCLFVALVLDTSNSNSFISLLAAAVVVTAGSVIFFYFFYLIAWLHSFTTHIDLTNNQEHIRYSKVRWAYPCGLCAWTVWYGERDRVHSLAHRHIHTHARTKSFR